MGRQRRDRKREQRRRFVPRLEFLETRALPAAAFPGLTLDPLLVPKFENDVPNALDPSFVFQPTTPGGTHYEIGMYQTEQDLGLGLTDEYDNSVQTTVWGYGTSPEDATYPGRTFVVQKDQQITVHWTNNLVDAEGDPLPHLLPVDSTLHWADPLNEGRVEGPYTGPVPLVTHLHGGHTESASDGLPEAWFTPGFAQTGDHWVKETYVYDNDQEAATLWYHDHALGITRLNVYAGLAGFYLVRDEFDTGVPDDPTTPENENPLGLPTGPYEIPLVIQDRMFTEDGQLYYPSEPEVPGAPEPSVLPEFFGDVILVNGKAWPKLEVEPREYRFRLLNGSDSRVYNLILPGQPFLQIGTDDGLLENPVAVSQLTLGPGERADVVVDFSHMEGRTIIMKNNGKTPFPGGDAIDPRTAGQIMAFKVTKPLETDSPLTSITTATDLRPDYGPIAPLEQTGATRGLILFEGTDTYGRLQPMLGTVDDGTLLWDDPITENPTLDDVEVWEIYNATEDAHPIHLHLVAFQILGRQKFQATLTPKEQADGSVGGIVSDIRLLGQPRAPEANQAGWKDTVVVYPGEVARVIAKFDRPGRYVWHCHILSHEDHEMMRPYTVVAPPTAPATVSTATTGDVASAPAVVLTAGPDLAAIGATGFPVVSGGSGGADSMAGAPTGDTASSDAPGSPAAAPGEHGDLSAAPGAEALTTVSTTVAGDAAPAPAIVVTAGPDLAAVAIVATAGATGFPVVSGSSGGADPMVEALIGDSTSSDVPALPVPERIGDEHLSAAIAEGADSGLIAESAPSEPALDLALADPTLTWASLGLGIGLPAELSS